MTWEQVKDCKYAQSLKTPAGTYHVSAGLVMGKWRFTAWPPAPPAAPQTGGYDWRDYVHNSLGCFDDAEAARRCCEEHAGLR